MVFYVGADDLFEFAGAAWDVVKLLDVDSVGYGGGGTVNNLAQIPAGDRQPSA